MLTGALAVGLCFVVDNPVPLAVAALLFFAIGCGCLYRANTVLNDVNFSQVDFEHAK
ncbi:conserved hypothetical protein (Ankyrin repeat domain)(part 2) [Wolbachia pipientis wAlbB]|nr:conserved hypothetical protein (Ankyrin repeat domain)(part 2) [Wolbachia pipientis wAlbB]